MRCLTCHGYILMSRYGTGSLTPSHDGCRVWVARRGGCVLGFLALDGDDLDQLYLRPGHYRQGIGARLLALAKWESSGRLCLHTFQRNVRARAFYEAHGFRIVDLNDGSRNEEREPDVQYEWTIET